MKKKFELIRNSYLAHHGQTNQANVRLCSVITHTDLEQCIQRENLAFNAENDVKTHLKTAWRLQALAANTERLMRLLPTLDAGTRLVLIKVEFPRRNALD